jgi:hypothetical protein
MMLQHFEPGVVPDWADTGTPLDEIDVEGKNLVRAMDSLIKDRSKSIHEYEKGESFPDIARDFGGIAIRPATKIACNPDLYTDWLKNEEKRGFLGGSDIIRTDMALDFPMNPLPKHTTTEIHDMRDMWRSNYVLLGTPGERLSLLVHTGYLASEALMKHLDILLKFVHKNPSEDMHKVRLIAAGEMLRQGDSVKFNSHTGTFSHYISESFKLVDGHTQGRHYQTMGALLSHVTSLNFKYTRKIDLSGLGTLRGAMGTYLGRYITEEKGIVIGRCFETPHSLNVALLQVICRGVLDRSQREPKELYERINFLWSV